MALTRSARCPYTRSNPSTRNDAADSAPVEWKRVPERAILCLSAGLEARHTEKDSTMLNLIALATFSAAVTVPMVIVTLRRPLIQNA